MLAIRTNHGFTFSCDSSKFNGHVKHFLQQHFATSLSIFTTVILFVSLECATQRAVCRHASLMQAHIHITGF